MSQHRRHRRFTFRHDDPEHELRIEDLALGGLRLRSNRALRIGQKVAVELPQGAETLGVTARIVRACLSGVKDLRYEYGAKLSGLGKPDRQRLEQLVSSLEASQSRVPEDPRFRDLEQLRHQVADLQKEIARLEGHRAEELERRSQERASDALDKTALAEAFRTSFGLARFAHLVRLSQPLVKTSQSPADHLVGQRYALVANALTDSTDLKSLSAALRRELAEDAIVETLFELYERKRIDFA